MDKDMLGMVISDMIFKVFGFGPSKSICVPFAEAVLGEAEAVKHLMELP